LENVPDATTALPISMVSLLPDLLQRWDVPCQGVRQIKKFAFLRKSNLVSDIRITVSTASNNRRVQTRKNASQEIEQNIEMQDADM